MSTTIVTINIWYFSFPDSDNDPRYRFRNSLLLRSLYLEAIQRRGRENMAVIISGERMSEQYRYFLITSSSCILRPIISNLSTHSITSTTIQELLRSAMFSLIHSLFFLPLHSIQKNAIERKKLGERGR